LQANVPNEASVYLELELDAETKPEYQLILTLTDGHLGEGNFITQSMLILVEDVNDNAPIFRPHSPVVRVREHSKPQIITTVEATDRDSGIFGQVTITTTTTTTNKNPNLC
jgi:cadherin 23